MQDDVGGHRRRDAEPRPEEPQSHGHDHDGQDRGRHEQAVHILGARRELQLLVRQKGRHGRKGESDERDLHLVAQLERFHHDDHEQGHHEIHREEGSYEQPGMPQLVSRITGSRPEPEREHHQKDTDDEGDGGGFGEIHLLAFNGKR